MRPDRQQEPSRGAGRGPDTWSSAPFTAVVSAWPKRSMPMVWRLLLGPRPRRQHGPLQVREQRAGLGAAAVDGQQQVRRRHHRGAPDQWPTRGAFQAPASTAGAASRFPWDTPP